MLRPAAIALCLCMGNPLAAAAERSNLNVNCDAGTGLTTRVGPDGLRVRIAGDVTGLVIEEAGRDLIITSTPAATVVEHPPRLGIAVVQRAGDVTIRLATNGADGLAKLTAYCGDSILDPKGWFGDAAALSATFGTSIGALDAPFPEQRLLDLRVGAYDDRTIALAEHLRAQAYIASGQSSLATEAFRVAADAWRNAGDPARSAAALAGIAEELVRTGQYAEAIALAQSHQAAHAPHYFGVRLENARCLALRYQNALEQASVCYERTTRWLQELDEPLELAATTLDFGTIELDRGRLAYALDLFTQAEALAVGPDAEEVRGRARFFMADAWARNGRIDLAMRDLHVAMEHFSAARARRWQGSALLRLASLLVDLGASGDARAAVAAALEIFNEADAPARVASAQLTLARSALAEQQPAQAARSADKAAQLYGRLGMPRELLIAKQLQAQALLAMGDVEAARSLLPDHSSPGDPPSLGLLLGELALERADEASFRAEVERLQRMPLGVQHRTRLAVLEAKAAARGSLEAGLARLDSHRAVIAGLQSSTGNPILHDRFDALLRDLEAEAVDLVAEGLLAGMPASERAASTRLRPHTESAPPSRFRPEDSGLEQALTAEFFPSSRAVAGASAQKALLAALAVEAPAPSDAPSSAVGTALPILQEGDVLLSVHEGSRRAIVTWSTRSGSSRHVVADRPALVRELAALHALLSRPDSALIELHRRSDAVGSQLLAAAGDAPLPARLWVLAPLSGMDVPWPMLRIGSGEALSSVPISLLRPAAQGAPAPTTSRASIDILLASGFTTPEGLSRLRAVPAEGTLVAGSVGARATRVTPWSTRSDLLAALARPRNWVHIAAHGTLKPGRIGGSGIWLDAPPGADRPDYVGWTELLGRQLDAELVVLNACQLAAQGGNAGSPMHSFTSALLRAGADHVVAAMWPVSDTAGAVWIPTLYRSLEGDASNTARALAAARSRLAGSRAFRHPFHWAGLVHATSVPGRVTPY